MYCIAELNAEKYAQASAFDVVRYRQIMPQ